MAMSLLRCEDTVHLMAFSNGFVPLPLTRADSLDAALSKCSNLPFDSTDCAAPMTHALNKKIAVDAFIVLTDNETNSGSTHPVVALKRYREAMGIDARLVVMAFSASKFSIADPEDRGMMDVAGLDSGVPGLIAQFLKGNV